MTAIVEHRPDFDVHNVPRCTCGWEHDPGCVWTDIDDAVLEYAKHFATEVQAAKPRTRRGGVDESEPTSASHELTRKVLELTPDAWVTANYVWASQAEFGAKRYSPQRIRTCLAGLVRAGVAEERRVGRYREYRLALACVDAMGGER